MIYNENETNRVLMKGIKAVADVVGVTLGPARNSVIIDRPDDLPPLVINDGVTIARNIALAKEEMIGAKLLIEVSKRAQEKAGDGTTTAAVLANALIEEGTKLPFNPSMVRESFELLTDMLCDELVKHSNKVSMENIFTIAKISANNDDYMAYLIDKAVQSIGLDGIITVEPSHTGKDSTEIVNGFEASSGYIHNVLERVNGKNKRMENPLVLISDQDVKEFDEILPALEIAKAEKKPLLLVLKSISPIALNSFVVNSMNGTIDASIAKAEDISIWTGLKLGDLATYLDTHYFISALNEDIKNVELSLLGQCESVLIDSTKTIFIGGGENEEKILKRIEMINEDSLTAETEFHKKKHMSRVGKLNGRAAIIKIHGESEQEIQNKKDRLDDSLNAIRSAIQTGYTLGSGLSLIYYNHKSVYNNNQYLADTVPIEIIEAYRDALTSVFNTLYYNLKNENLDYNDVLGKTMRNLSYDGIEDEWYDTNIKEVVIDPTGVVISSLRSAVSVAGYVLTAKRMIMRERHELDRAI